MSGTVRLCAFAVLTGLVLSQDAFEARVVSIAQGPVRGHRKTSYNVFEFLNIPYATAPTGADRFKAPLPPPVWRDTFNAVDRGITCPQPSLDFRTSTAENCLVVNVYVPGTEQSKLPVLVIVHGGGFQVGSGTMYIPRGFVDSQKVIVVTFNYRLGAYGFLCLGTEEAPGNAGMKDQVALLRWVKDNIASFGGDPDNVTLSGCSAGGSSVDSLLLSKLTDGLVKRAIVDSGCSTATFGVQQDPLQNAKDIVHKMNYYNVDVENITALTDFYTTTPLEILTAQHFMEARDSYLIYQPCVEKDIGQEMFFDDAPINILRSGNYKKLPILYGYTDREGMLRLDTFDQWKVEMNEKFSDFLPADLEFENEQQKEDLAQEVKEFYFGNKTVDENTILSYVDYFTDVLVLTAVNRAVTLQVKAKNNEVYLYDFSFVHNATQFIPHTDVQGANHCEQVFAIFDVDFTASPEFLEMSRTMRQMFLNFIQTGNPTPEGANSGLTWLPAGANRSPHLSVGSNFALSGVPYESRTAFWDAIYGNHYRTPAPPK